MNEPDEKKGISDVRTDEQTVTTIIFEVDYGEVCRLCMCTPRIGSKDTSTVFTFYEDSIQFCDLAMALTSVKVSPIRSQ